MTNPNQTPEDETFRKLKREPDEEKVWRTVMQARADAELPFAAEYEVLDRMGWTHKEFRSLQDGKIEEARAEVKVMEEQALNARGLTRNEYNEVVSLHPKKSLWERLWK